MAAEDAYLRVLDHQRHMEARALATLGHFLTANAFLFAAWAQLYQFLKGSDFGGLDLVMVLMPSLGYGRGLVWAHLGQRNWGYARRLVAELHKLGRAEGERPVYKALRYVEEQARLFRTGTQDSTFAWSSHPSVLTLTPLFVSLMHLAMFVAWGHARGFLGHQYWFTPLMLAAFGVLGIVGVHAHCRIQEQAVEEAVKAARA